MSPLPPDLRLPDYADGCLTNLVPELLRPPGRRTAAWLPGPARAASQVVLLVLDGLGWNQLQDRRDLAPTLAAMAGGPITSVAPTTTATALSSIVLGRAPAAHGVVGYRLRVDGPEGDLVLNVLRWRTSAGDARESVPAVAFATGDAFGGRAVPVVTKAEFASTGFTAAQDIRRLHGWFAASSIAVEVDGLLRAGEPFVYAYYEGVDKVAHAHGFGAHYDAELVAADRLVADVAAVLPPGAALVVTADHGQVEVGDRLVELAPEVRSDVTLVSGEGRFTWLHARPGRLDALVAACRERYEATGLAVVRTRQEIVDDGWFGGPLSSEVAERLGEVAIVARRPVAFLDPADPGASTLVCRHGSLTPDEMLVPCLATAAPATRP
ncbi:MAG TPA: alkaline phosphatase family protein [Acidimicrobiales bacterium]|nr:alkaline phosphatase family protein [Acidimicrobiales bacterium]